MIQSQMVKNDTICRVALAQIYRMNRQTEGDTAFAVKTANSKLQSTGERNATLQLAYNSQATVTVVLAVAGL